MINARIVQSQLTGGEKRKKRDCQERWMSLSGRRSRCIPASLTIQKKVPSLSSLLLRSESGLLTIPITLSPWNGGTTLLPRFSVVIDGGWVRSKFYGGEGGWNCYLDRQVRLFSFFSWNFVIYRPEFDPLYGWLKVWDRWPSRRGDVHKSSGPGYTCMTSILFL